MSRWLLAGELAKELGVSRYAIYKKGKSGEIKTKREPKVNGFLYDAESVKRKDEVIEDFFATECPDYFYDEKNQTYLFHSLPGQKGAVTVSKSKIDALIWDYSNQTGGLTLNEICRKYGIARRALIHILRVLGKTHDSAPFSDEDLSEKDDDTLVESLLRAKEQRVMVKAERMRYAQMTKQSERYEVLDKILLPRIEEALRARESAHPVTFNSTEIERANHIVVLGLTDLHVGKRGVCGWDMEKARRASVETCLGAMDEAISKWGAPELWVLPCGSDLIHIDNYLNSTTKGTSQDVDGDPVDMLLTAFVALEQMIEGLRAVAPVHVVSIPGNHDRVLGMSVGLMLNARYLNDTDVTVDIAKNGSAYLRHGNSLIGFNHGDMIGAKDLPALMSSDRADDWGECKGGWEWFTGHWHGHKVRADEYNGCRVWTMPSLSGTDRWHKLKGYSHNRRQIALYRVDKQNGVGGVEFVEIKGLD